MQRKRILLAALLAALIVCIVAITSRHIATVANASSAAAPGFTIISPAAGSLVPCGQPFTVTWTGGDPSAMVDVVLIDQQAFQVFQGFGVEPNTGSRVVTIGPGSCGRPSQFYVEDSPRTTWTHGPVFNVGANTDEPGKGGASAPPSANNVTPEPAPVPEPDRRGEGGG